MPAKEKQLRNILKVNASFSAMSGLLLIFDKSLIERLGIENGLVAMWVGIGLILFAASVFHAGIRKEINMTQVKSIIFQDFVWVLASIVVLVLQPWSLSGLGYWLIGIVALIVGLFGLLQLKFSRP